MAVGLTDLKIRALKAPKEGRVEFPDEKVLGLRVRVSSKGTKTFILRKRQGAKVHNLTLGAYDDRFGIADARKKARALLSDLEAGKAPAPVTRGAWTQTFKAMLPTYLASKEHLRSHKEVKRILEVYALPKFGDRLAETISRGEVTELVDDVARVAPTMARAVHAQLSSFFTWAMPRLDRLQVNPCRDAGRPDKPQARDRVLDDFELTLIWQASSTLLPAFKAFYRLLTVTAQRRNEVAGIEWSELNRDARIWIIPPGRTKNSVANMVPLSDLAISIFDELAGGDVWPDTGLVLTTRGDTTISGYSKAKWQLDVAVLRQMRKGIPDTLPDDQKPQLTPWRVHDLRRTAATGFQRLGVRFEVTEAVLNHVSGARGGVAGVYQRHDWKEEKRAALDAWSTHLNELISATSDSINVPFKQPQQDAVA